MAKWSCHISVSRSVERVGAEEHAVDPPPLQPNRLGRGQRQVGQPVREGGEAAGHAAGPGLPASSRSIDGSGPSFSRGFHPRWRRSRPGGAGGRPGGGPRASSSGTYLAQGSPGFDGSGSDRIGISFLDRSLGPDLDLHLADVADLAETFGHDAPEDAARCRYGYSVGP